MLVGAKAKSTICAATLAAAGLGAAGGGEGGLGATAGAGAAATLAGGDVLGCAGAGGRTAGAAEDGAAAGEDGAAAEAAGAELAGAGAEMLGDGETEALSRGAADGDTAASVLGGALEPLGSTVGLIEGAALAAVDAGDGIA